MDTCNSIVSAVSGPQISLLSYNEYLQSVYTTVRKVEVTNFMKYSDHMQELKKSPSVFHGPPSCGKSSLIIAIYLGLGQDDVLQVYGLKLQDTIKINREMAIVRLTLTTPLDSEMRDLYGNTLQISRKIQIDSNGYLLPSIWRIKSLSRHSIQRIISPEFLMSFIIPKLGLTHWNTGVPSIITSEILHYNLERSPNYWYNEFIRLMDIKIPGLNRCWNNLSIETQALTDIQFQIQNPQNANFYTDVEDKVMIRQQICRNTVGKVTSKISRAHQMFSEELELTFKFLSCSMGLHGHCKVDHEAQEIHFVVQERFFDKNLIQPRKLISTLRNKQIGLAGLILSFWSIMDISPFYVIEASFEHEQPLRELVLSENFKKILCRRPKQMVVTFR